MRVGPDKKEFSVQKDLICHESPYFKKAFTGSFLEADTGTVELEDVPAPLFSIFVIWLYCHKIVYATSDDTTTIRQDFQKLLCNVSELQDDAEQEQLSGNAERRTVPQREMEFAVDPDGQAPGTWPLDVLSMLYVLGDRFDVPEFRNTVMDAIWECVFQPRWLYVTAHSIRYIYQNTPQKSHLRDAIIHIAAYHQRWEETLDDWQDTPNEFLHAVSVTMGRRLPYRLCSDCHSEAIRDNCIKSVSLPGKHETEDKAAFAFDKCFYHDHTPGITREACRRQSKFSRTWDA